MKKSIILSGGPASGKTTIARSIQLLYPEKRVWEIDSWSLDEILSQEDCPENFHEFYDLIIVDGCHMGQIFAYEEILNGPVNIKENPFTNEVVSEPNPVGIIYTTQTDLFGITNGNFSIINCNNRHNIGD